MHHGWPSFRPQELVKENVVIHPEGEMQSKCGTHLGHNLPDASGARYCIDLVCIAGSPSKSNVTHGVTVVHHKTQGDHEQLLLAETDEEIVSLSSKSMFYIVGACGVAFTTLVVTLYRQRWRQTSASIPSNEILGSNHFVL